MRRYIIKEVRGSETLQKGDSYLCRIEIKDGVTNLLTSPSTVKITVTSETGEVVINNKPMIEDGTGIFYWDFAISSAFDYIKYTIDIVAIESVYTSKESFDIYVLPWEANEQVRKLSGAVEKKDIEDSSLNLIIYEAWKEVRGKVFNYHDEAPICNPDTGAYTDGTNKIFRLKNTPVADQTDNGEYQGRTTEYPYHIYDAEATWKDEDGAKHYANLTIDDADWGDITLTKSTKDVFVKAGYHKLFTTSTGNDVVYVYDSGSWTTETFVTGVAASYFRQYNSVLYGFSQSENSMYSYNNNTGLWTTVTTTLPSPYRAVVFEDELYVSTKSNGTVWKYNGTTFTNCGSPGSSSYGLTVLDNELYCADQDGSALYKYVSNQTWVKVCDVAVAPSEVATYNNKIYMRCFDDVYTWDGASCVEDINDIKGRVLQVYKDILYLTSSFSHKVYSTDGGGWTTAKDLSNAFTMAVMGDELYVRYGVGANDYTKYDGDTWTSIGNYGAAGTFMGSLDVDDEYDYAALPSDTCNLRVKYWTESVHFSRDIMHQAVNYLAAHKTLVQLQALRKSTLADLDSNEKVILANPQRFKKEYLKLLQIISDHKVGQDRKNNYWKRF